MDQTNGNLWLKTSGTATATGWAQLGGTTPIASGGTGQTTALAARSSTGLDIEARHAVVDADYAATATDRYIGYTSLTATRTVTLPKASNVNAGAHFVVGDESGSASVTVQIAFAAFAGDTIDGGASIAIEWPYGRREFVSDGAGRWLSDAGIQRRYEKDVASGYAGLDAGTLLLLSEVPTISVAKGGTGQVTTLAARSSAGLNIEDTTPVADAAYAAGNTDRTVAYTSLTAPRIVTLPLAANCNPGQAFTVADYSGSCSVTNTITLTRQGSETINGATTYVINTAYGTITLIADGVGKWAVAGGGTAGAAGACGVSGTTGACGVSGTTGGAGAAGACGVSGTTGACGVSGTAGAAGACGVSGTAGAAGACGVSGTAGACGVSGTAGAAGACGVSGTAGACGVSGVSGVSGVGDWDSIVNVAGSDATTTGQSLVDITGLTYALAANHTYEFEAVLTTASSDVVGLQVGAHCTQTLQRFAAMVLGGTTTTQGSSCNIPIDTASSTTYTSQSTAAGIVYIKGSFISNASTGGTFSVRFLKVTSGTATIRIGSTLKVKQVL
jgi:hypothetical protein